MDSKKNDLFNNPLVNSAMKALTPEQVEEYEQIGKYMFSTNYDDKNPKPKSLEDETVKGLMYIRESLKAGLHPRDMETKEIQLMYEIYGSKWYEEFDYDESEVPKPALPVEITGPPPPLTKKQIKKLEKKTRRKELRKIDGVNRKKIK